MCPERASGGGVGAAGDVCSQSVGDYSGSEYDVECD